LRNLYARNDIRPAYRMHMRVDVVVFTAMVSPKLDNVLGEVLCAEDDLEVDVSPGRLCATRADTVRNPDASTPCCCDN
jgi:hypothetical protein